MEMEHIIKLIDAVSKANIMNFQIEEGNFKLSMDKLAQRMEVPSGVKQTAAIPYQSVDTQAAVLASVVEQKKEEVVNTAAVIKNESPAIPTDAANIKIIESPIVGTYYSSPGPDSKEFVQVGDVVKIGQVLCIVEAMKLMNDIDSEYAGEIVEILVQNEQMVEYGQPLFKIKV